MRRLIGLAALAACFFQLGQARADEVLWVNGEFGASSLVDGTVFGLGAGFRVGPWALGALGRYHAAGQTAWQAGGVVAYHVDIPPDIFVKVSPFLAAHALYTEANSFGWGVDVGVGGGLDIYLLPNFSLGLEMDVGPLFKERTGTSFLSMVALRAGVHF